MQRLINYNKTAIVNFQPISVILTKTSNIDQNYYCRVLFTDSAKRLNTGNLFQSEIIFFQIFYEQTRTFHWMIDEISLTILMSKQTVVDITTKFMARTNSSLRVNDYLQSAIIYCRKHKLSDTNLL